MRAVKSFSVILVPIGKEVLYSRRRHDFPVPGLSLPPPRLLNQPIQLVQTANHVSVLQDVLELLAHTVPQLLGELFVQMFYASWYLLGGCREAGRKVVIRACFEDVSDCVSIELLQGCRAWTGSGGDGWA